VRVAGHEAPVPDASEDVCFGDPNSGLPPPQQQYMEEMQEKFAALEVELLKVRD